MSSILNDTKKTLGIQTDYQHFDPDIIMHINTALSVVQQTSFVTTTIEDERTTWESLVLDPDDISMVKNYVYLRTRLGFDPPATSFAIEAIERQLRELEFRLNVNREEDQWTDPEPAA